MQKIKKILGGIIITGLVITAVSVSFDVPPADADFTTGLTNHWKFDEGSGTTASDSIGANTGTLSNGPTWAAGQIGSAINFDGVDDRISGIAYSGTVHTLAFWVNSAGGIVLGRSNAGANQIGFSGNNLRYGITNGLFDVAHGGISGWTHIAFVRNGTAVSAYKDGVLLGSGTLAANSNLDVNQIGARSTVSYFNGSIDDIRIYNRALSASDINELFNSTGGEVEPTPPPPAPAPPPPPPTNNPPPPPSSTPGQCSSISQFGITWTFNQSHACGQFANGDWWVVGPVRVNSITKPNGTGRDGSMLNPIPHSLNHGYDSRIPGYSTTLDVSTQLPLTINPVSSLVSTISGSLARPVLDVGAILTVVSSVPSAGSFRPPYAGTSKPMHNTNSLQTNLLPSLAPVGSTPTIASLAAKIEKPWIDNRTEWQGDYLHPDKNMENYGGAMAKDAHDIALRLLMNDPIESKNVLLIRFVQLGIDNFGLVYNGAQWGNVGGTIGVGRKLPIIFAGVLLGNDPMKNVAHNFDTRKVFQEDGQTFYLTQEAKDATYHPVNCSGDSNFCHPGFYDSDPLGTAVWGDRHYKWETESTYNYLPGKPQYLSSTYQSTLGAALVVHLMGIKNLWNWNAHLDFVDRQKSLGTGGSYGSGFAHSMWSAYRNTTPVTPPPPPVVPPPPSTISKSITLDLEGRTNKVISGTLQVLNSSKTLIKSYPFTTNSSGTVSLNLDQTSGSLFFKIKASPYLSRLLSGDINTTLTFPQLKTGDINQDNIVNSIDFSTLNTSWFTTQQTADLNRDNIVNSLDFSLMNRNWFQRGEE